MKRFMLALLFANIGLPTAHAQYVNPYYPQGSPGYNRLNGQADVTRAQGDYINSLEQARIAREQALQAKIDTKRKAFDEMNYEKANTPSYFEELSKEKALLLNRMMTYPRTAEINEGKTLNTMLPFLQSLTSSGSQGQPVNIPKFAVAALNLTSGGPGQGSVGMLGKKGPLDWPVPFRGPHQKKLDTLLPAAVAATIDGSLSAKMLKDVRTEMTALREDLRQQVKRDEIALGSYSSALDFYDSLTASIKALERPDARKQLSGAFTMKAGNVQELVDFMTDNGLNFAAATPGNENAYKVVHDACVRYARTAQASAGFTSMNAPAGGKKN